MRSILIIMLFLPFLGYSHGGEDHGKEQKAAIPATAYFSSEAISDKYEALIKYQPLGIGANAKLSLYLSNVNTNEPVDVRSLNVTIPGASTKVSSKRLDKGIYELQTVFPDKKVYSMNIAIDGALGADLIQVSSIEPGKQLAEEHHEESRTNNWLFLLLGVLGGALLTLIGYRIFRRRINRNSVGIVLLALLVPIATNEVTAHGGEDHGGKKTTGAMSDAFRVEKETQFLFKIITQKITSGTFNKSVSVMGTVVPAPGGSAVIQSPQVGKIVSINVRPGQQVSKGQTIATVEQQVDAGTQIDIMSQRNTINAEYQAAKIQYERLKAIEDIAAKKDVTEAKARYNAATENKRLFEANANQAKGSTKIIALTAPISGVVGPFSYAVGAVINPGQTLLEITNLNNVYIEAQIFSNDVAALESAVQITAVPNSAANPIEYSLTLVAQPQVVNSENQSQKVLFSLQIATGQLKIGENVSVIVKTGQQQNGIVVPSEAVVDVNGKPALFIKDRAEQFSISFVSVGQTDSKETVVLKGVEEEEKIVTENIYELKMIYLNQ